MLAFIALGWSLLASVGLAVFAIVLAPTVGQTMNIVFSSRRGNADFTVVTSDIVAVSFWVALALVILAIASVALAAGAPRPAYVLLVVVCFAAPFWTLIVLANAVLDIVEPTSPDVWLVATGVVGLFGLTIGGLSFTVGPTVIESLQTGTLFGRGRSRHASPIR